MYEHALPCCCCHRHVRTRRMISTLHRRRVSKLISSTAGEDAQTPSDGVCIRICENISSGSLPKATILVLRVPLQKQREQPATKKPTTKKRLIPRGSIESTEAPSNPSTQSIHRPTLLFFFSCVRLFSLVALPKVKKSKKSKEQSSPVAAPTAEDAGEKKKKKDKSDRKKNKKNKKGSAPSAAGGGTASANAAAAAAGGAATGEGTKVHVEGMKVTPLTDFALAGMPAEVMKYITLRGWEEPTQIQAHCWPVLNAGRDVIGIAETGSGKTLAFSLPAMARIFKRSKVNRRYRWCVSIVYAASC